MNRWKSVDQDGGKQSELPDLYSIRVPSVLNNNLSGRTNFEKIAFSLILGYVNVFLNEAKTRH